MIFFTRMIDSNYIEYERFIPKTNRIFVKAESDSIIRCLERASLVTEEKTMGQMKKDGIMVSKNENGDFEVQDLSEGWYTFYVQTDKRDYFTLCVYLSN